jgi:hypothetical protein
MVKPEVAHSSWATGTCSSFNRNFSLSKSSEKTTKKDVISAKRKSHLFTLELLKFILLP